MSQRSDTPFGPGRAESWRPSWLVVVLMAASFRLVYRLSVDSTFRSAVLGCNSSRPPNRIDARALRFANSLSALTAMSFHFINPALLLGLLGLSLPLIVHLLSRRRYDVVHWGAMQFLQLGRNARRRLRLEQILLMLVRMGLIALIVLAVARPWAQGGFLTNLVSTQSRDVVLVIDGSYSMGWEGGALTPHSAARQWAHKFLEDLRPGDTVTLIDARERPRLLIDPPTRDFSRVRDELDNLPAPAGSASLPESIFRGVQVLSRTSHVARDLIVLTDGQAHGWQAQDEGLWIALDELRKQPSVRPNLWVVNVAGELPAQQRNLSVERLQLSRELTVPNFPIRITTTVKYRGSGEPVTRRVYFEVDGQRLGDKTLNVQIEPGGERTVEFQHRFSSPGSHRLSVVLDPDELPGDDRADAAVVVAEAIPVLLVDGDEGFSAARSETFFAKAALSAAENETPWVKATTVSAARIDEQRLSDFQVVVLANVGSIDAELAERLREYVKAGGGLVVAPGDQSDAAAYNELLFANGSGLLPARLDSIKEDQSAELGGVHIVNSSLELPWTSAFRKENAGDLTQARFAKWWKLALEASGGTEPSSAPEPAIAARLETGDPFLITQRLGRGGVLLLAGPLDADWSTLPAQYDYVPLLHELVLYLASQKSPRNVEVGTPLVLEVPRELDLNTHAFYGPGGVELSAERAGDDLQPLVRLDDTSIPGPYVFGRKGARQTAGEGQVFVVNFDRKESDLTPLSDADRAALTRDERMAFVPSREDLARRMFADTSRSEFWHLLLLVFLGLLVCEAFMTRRLVHGGHAELDPAEFGETEAVAGPAPVLQ